MTVTCDDVADRLLQQLVLPNLHGSTRHIVSMHVVSYANLGAQCTWLHRGMWRGTNNTSVQLVVSSAYPHTFEVISGVSMGLCLAAPVCLSIVKTATAGTAEAFPSCS